MLSLGNWNVIKGGARLLGVAEPYIFNSMDSPAIERLFIAVLSREQVWPC